MYPHLVQTVCVCVISETTITTSEGERRRESLDNTHTKTQPKLGVSLVVPERVSEREFTVQFEAAAVWAAAVKSNHQSKAAINLDSLEAERQ